jgi:hypothetical protein
LIESLPVEAQLDHVVPPDVVVDGVVRVIVPAVFDVPRPGLGPQDVKAVEEDGRVVQPTPSVRQKYM